MNDHCIKTNKHLKYYFRIYYNSARNEDVFLIFTIPTDLKEKMFIDVFPPYVFNRNAFQLNYMERVAYE